MPFNINIPVWQEKINKCPNNKKEIHVYNDKYKHTRDRLFGLHKHRHEKKSKTAMVNNSTNINKTDNHLSHLTIEHKTTTTYDVGDLGLSWDRHINVTGLNLFMGFQLSLDNWNFNVYTDINKQ